jgi:exopolysaccharide biosynthesis WecB/TagA/CpsF family protein
MVMASAISVLNCGDIQLWSAPGNYLFFAFPHQFKQIVTVNAEIFVLAHENPKLMRIVSRAINTIDGRILQFICKVLYPNLAINRLAGADLIYDLARYCHASSEKLFLLGSAPEANAKAIEVLRKRHPRLQITGFAPPMCTYPFPEVIDSDILEKVAVFRPNHLVVCFGPTKQEQWIHDHAGRLAELGVRRAYGFGATIDFVSGRRRRAPKLLQLLGTEWLFRLACEPRQRFLRTLTMFRMPLYAARTKRRTARLSPNVLSF